MQEFWLKQDKDKPLFPDIVWSRPENKAQAGKLLIFGGNVHSFNAVNTAYSESIKAGIGSTRVLLPDSLQKTLHKFLPEADYAPSTPSGSLATQALAQILDEAAWADCVLAPGGLGKNSETAVLMEKVLDKYSSWLVLAGDAVDSLSLNSAKLSARPKTLLVLNISQLQKIAITLKSPRAFTSRLPLSNFVNVTHEFMEGKQANIVIIRGDQVIAADNKRVVSTSLASPTPDINLVKVAAYCAAWLAMPTSSALETVASAIAQIN
ncbi:MAG TPA: hypothetical protein VL989_00690 [Candidatus Sulfotelmatobacter sp.]|nr:hypothetical protein [Candidatus Sulfotelmatobacter sp.]